MTIAILGDLNLSQLLIMPRFRLVLNTDFVFCLASSMASFAQYRTMLPPGTRYLVVGCLSPLLGDQPLTADVELSNKFLLDWFVGSLLKVTFILERFIIEFSQTLSDILDANSGLRAMVIRPLPRPGPGPFGASLSILQVNLEPVT